MYNYSYYMMKNLYDVNSLYKRINNAINVVYGYMTPQQMICDACKDEIIRIFLFG